MLKMCLSRASGTPRVVRCLGLHAFITRFPGFGPWLGANIPQAEQRSQRVLSQKTSCFSPSVGSAEAVHLDQLFVRILKTSPYSRLLSSALETVLAAEVGLSLERPVAS